MAHPTNFDQANMPLFAGNNPNTNNMPVCLAKNPALFPVPEKDDPENPAPNPYFYISKWKFSEDEKKAFRDRVFKALVADFWVEEENGQYSQMMDIIEKEFDHVFLCIMHTPVPAFISATDPFETAGYVPVKRNQN